MELGFFTQPIHTHGRNYAETLEEDRDAFVLADRLGYSEGFIGEHMTNLHENVANGLIFVASLAGLTENIKLGTGVHNLAFSHPLVIASNVAMVDNMLKGRFLFGIGAGITFSDAEALEILGADRKAMFLEAIEHVLALWENEPPYDLKGEHWNISTAKTSWPELGLGEVSKPYQRPHPPIFTGAGDPESKSLAAYGARGWAILASDTLPASRLAGLWENYAAGCAEAGRDAEAERKNWRVVRSIFVAEDEKTAVEYGKTSPDSPYRFHFNDFHLKFQKGKKLDMFKADLAVPDEQVTLDYALDNCVIAGTPEQVVEQILAVREAAGPFGTLVYAGKDWTDPALSRRSMELMAEEVMPAVNAAIGDEAWASAPTLA
jgi:alkanesulfonate monooxygenase SsuD/methylene tetrahydromethanopterin reductase-like flavin-dependent oxidoreductase (luciferase family)